MQSTAARLSVVPESLIQNFGSLLGRAAGFRNLPFHLTGANFILRNAAGFARAGVNHRRGAGLKLPGATRGDENVAIVAVEAFDQFHGLSPLILGHRILISESCRSSFVVLRQRKPRTALLFSHEIKLTGAYALQIWLRKTIPAIPSHRGPFKRSQNRPQPVANAGQAAVVRKRHDFSLLVRERVPRAEQAFGAHDCL